MSESVKQFHEEEALKQFAITSRGGQCRILVHDPVAALREMHPLIPVLQRLSSCLLVRVPHVYLIGIIDRSMRMRDTILSARL